MKKMIIALAAGAAALCAGAQENERRDRTADYRGAVETSVADDMIDVDSCSEWYDGVLKPCPKAKDLVVAKGRQSGIVYGMSFGVGPKAGARHLRIAFRQDVPVGAVFLNSGKVSISVLKAPASYPGDPSNEELWQPLSCLQGDKKPARVAAERGCSFWYGAKELTTRAIRITAKVADTDAVDDAGNRHGSLSSIYLLKDQLFNISPYAVPMLLTTDATRRTSSTAIWSRGTAGARRLAAKPAASSRGRSR